tara:strand:+ start:2295 stop:4517 length:2223 start_codon:yes stop_codon:yes gene_type:complete
MDRKSGSAILRRASALAIAVGSLAGTASPALAQEAEPAPEQTESQPQTETVPSQGTIIVTARKREETLQDTSSAVSVVGADLLQDKQVADVTQLQSLVPTITIGETVGLLKINIRGLGNSTVTRSEDSDVVLHVDGAVVARPEAQGLALFDLERVEVLRGPQGTLYGRNSTGGTINLVTRKPTPTFEGYASFTVGNYNLTSAEAAFSGPLTNTISARAAIVATQRGGYGTNIVTGNDIEDQKRYAGRLHLLFEPTPDLSVLLTGEYANQDDASGFFPYQDKLYPFDPGYVPRGAGGYSDPRTRDGASNVDPRLEKETWSLTGTIDYDITDRLAVRSQTNYRELDFFVGQDLDKSGILTQTYAGIPLEDEQFSQELQLLYNSDRLSAIGGLFYFYEKFGGSTDVGFGPNDRVYLSLVGESETRAFAPFFNASYELLDTLTLRVGGRYTSEERSIVNDTILNGVRITTDNDIADDQRDISAYTGEYGIDWQPTDNLLLYGTFSQGFRSGAALIFQSNSPIIDPTSVDNYEIGLKAGDERLFVNLAAFIADIQNVQRTQASVTSGGLLTTRVNNVDALRTKGIEVEAGWSPTRNFNLFGSLAYLDSKFKNFVTDDPIIQAVNPIQVAGNRPAQAPELKFSVRSDYTVEFGNGSTLELAGDVGYQSEVFFDEFNRAPFAQDAYALVNASATYTFADQQLSLQVWAKNLTDEMALADMGFSAFGQVISQMYIPPRTVGATMRYEF